MYLPLSICLLPLVLQWVRNALVTSSPCPEQFHGLRARALASDSLNWNLDSITYLDRPLGVSVLSFSILKKRVNNAFLFSHVVIQLLSHVWLCDPWPAACQAPLTSEQAPLWVFSNSCPLSQWYYLAISSSVAPRPPALSLSQHQNLFQWVGSSHQVAEVLVLHHQSFQWIFRIDFL